MPAVRGIPRNPARILHDDNLDGSEPARDKKGAKSLLRGANRPKQAVSGSLFNSGRDWRLAPGGNPED